MAFIESKVNRNVSRKKSLPKNEFHQIRITKSKVIHIQIPVPKWEKRKKWEKIFWVIRGLQTEARGITNRDSFRDFKSGQKDYKSGQGFQIGPEIANRCRTQDRVFYELFFS